MGKGGWERPWFGQCLMKLQHLLPGFRQRRLMFRSYAWHTGGHITYHPTGSLLRVKGRNITYYILALAQQGKSELSMSTHSHFSNKHWLSLGFIHGNHIVRKGTHLMPFSSEKRWVLEKQMPDARKQNVSID